MFPDIPAAPANGLTCIVTFDARNGSPGFEGVSLGFDAENSDGSLAFFADQVFQPLALAWRSFRMAFHTLPGWNGGDGIRLSLNLVGRGAAIGKTHTGFLDHVVLGQISKPSALGMGWGGGTLWREAGAGGAMGWCGPTRSAQGRIARFNWEAINRAACGAGGVGVRRPRVACRGGVHFRFEAPGFKSPRAKLRSLGFPGGEDTRNGAGLSKCPNPERRPGGAGSHFKFVPGRSWA